MDESGGHDAKRDKAAIEGQNCLFPLKDDGYHGEGEGEWGVVVQLV